MTTPKILNTLEFLLLSLIPFGLGSHYDPHISHSFFYYNDLVRIILDILLLYAILIRLKDLVLNFNQLTNSPKKFYRPLIIYTLAIIPDMYFYMISLLFAKHFMPLMVIYLLPILILIIRIIAIKMYLSASPYSEDILDID